MAFWQFGYEERWASLTVRVISFKISNYVITIQYPPTLQDRQRQAGNRPAIARPRLAL